MKKVFVVCLLFNLLACKKDPDPSVIVHIGPDTIMPHSYFPVYPGSYWTYLKNDSIVYQDAVSPDYVYVNFDFLESYYDGKPISRVPVYVPKYQGSFIFGYEKAACPQAPFHGQCGLVSVLSDQVGYSFTVYKWVDHRLDPPVTYERVTVSDKIKRGRDSVLILKGYYYYINKYKMNPQPDTNLVTLHEYTKDVGLTFHCIVDTLTHDTTFKLKLIGYHIEK